MKKILISLLLLVAMSCVDSGTALVRLKGNESKLPPELKGLKVYSVCIDGDDYIRVAILNNKVNSLTYRHNIGNNNNETVIMADSNGSEQKIIHVKQILSENDSIIVLKK